MILQAYGLFEEAAVCYRRATQLEPTVLRWAYYLDSSKPTTDDASRLLRVFVWHFGSIQTTLPPN